ncbi:hypothetical protein [Pseudoduganella namucuonensis]|uniref:Uncharacterized protein n=1 Tax=Pseudoduganella namucuonensis TaxID=1035707 RepID=A0A1I7M5H0_9BURK|nr:hypothetical protein [Pseudoduganella namucuonensis]SFV17165.1 hypothetical protein SAMN05216552_106015 [Pseudoduganella namucuonensis]
MYSLSELASFEVPKHSASLAENTQHDAAAPIGQPESRKMTNETISIIETEQPQTSAETAPQQDGTPTAVQDSPRPQPMQAPVVQPPISKQEKRYQLSSKFATARCELETQVSASLNAKCGQPYKGVFEVRFDNPNEVTAKTLSAFCGNGAVFFTPNDLDQHPALKKLRKADEGINLSVLMSRAKRPTNIDDGSWKALQEMWNDVSHTLYTQGLAPMHILIAGVLAAKGLGGPKINKKLCSSLNEGTANTHEAMCQILDDLNKLLIQPPAIN